MDKDKRTLAIQLEKNEADATQAQQERIRTRRLGRYVLGVIATIAIISEIVVQVYIGLHK